MDHEKNYLAWILYALILGGVWLLVQPFGSAVAMGGVFAVLMFPWHQRLQKTCPSWFSAVLLTCFMTVVFLIPMAFLIFYVAKIGVSQLQNLFALPVEPGSHTPWFEAPWLEPWLAWLQKWIPLEVKEIENYIRDLVGNLAFRLGDFLGSILSHVPALAIVLSIIMVSLFFFLLDGSRLVLFLKKYSFLPKEMTIRLFQSVQSLCQSVILASVLSATAQTLVFLVICFFLGIRHLTLISWFMFLAAFIPLLGALPVTFGVVFVLILNGFYMKSFILIPFAFFVPYLDNVIRPLVLQGRSRLHPLLAFLAAFGGLKTLGLSGVFLGPILMGVAVELIRFYADEKEKKIKNLLQKN